MTVEFENATDSIHIKIKEGNSEEFHEKLQNLRALQINNNGHAATDPQEQKRIELWIHFYLFDLSLEDMFAAVTALADAMLMNHRSIHIIDIQNLPINSLFPFGRIFAGVIERMENLAELKVYVETLPDDVIDEMGLAKEAEAEAKNEFWATCVKNQSIGYVGTNAVDIGNHHRTLFEHRDSKLVELTLDCYNPGDVEIIADIMDDPTSAAVKELHVSWGGEDPMPQESCICIAIALSRNETLSEFYIVARIDCELNCAILGEGIALNRHLESFRAEGLCAEGLGLLTKGIAKNCVLKCVEFDAYRFDDGVFPPGYNAVMEECQRIADYTTKMNNLGRKYLHSPGYDYACIDDFWAKRLVVITSMIQKKGTYEDNPGDALIDFSALYSWIEDYPDYFVRAAGLGGHNGSKDDTEIGAKTKQTLSEEEWGEYPIVPQLYSATSQLSNSTKTFTPHKNC